MVRGNGKWLPKESFSKRQSFFIDAEEGFLVKYVAPALFLKKKSSTNWWLA